MAARKPLEDSVNESQDALEDTVVDPRSAAIAALRQGAEEDVVAEQEAALAAAPVLDDRSFRKWDGTTKYLVTGGAFMAIVDGDHMSAEQGTVLGLKAETAERGLEFGVLQKL